MTIRTRFSIFNFTLVIAIASLSIAKAQNVNFVAINHPFGTNGTYVHGVGAGLIVGDYYDTAFVSHGFIYDGSQFTAVDPPNSQSTSVRATDGRRVAGYFVDSSGIHGFVWDGTNYFTLNDPLAVGSNPVTEAYGIDGTNIVGYYTSNNIAHGFLYDGLHYFSIDFPGAGFGTYVQGISGTNMVGLADNVAAGNGHSFIYNGTTFTSLPNSLGANDAFGISGKNVAGYLFDGTTDHGFVWDQITFITLDYPQATLTTAYGIDGQTVVGTYFDAANLAHGFKATLTPVATLSIARNGNQIVVSWPTSLVGWILQTNANLASGVWENFNGTIINNLSTNVLPPTGDVFFRLLGP